MLQMWQSDVLICRYRKDSLCLLASPIQSCGEVALLGPCLLRDRLPIKMSREEEGFGVAVWHMDDFFGLEYVSYSPVGEEAVANGGVAELS